MPTPFDSMAVTPRPAPPRRRDRPTTRASSTTPRRSRPSGDAEFRGGVGVARRRGRRPFSGPPRGAGRGGAPRGGVAPVLRVRASRFKPAGREPLGERVRGAHARARRARRPASCRRTTRARAFCAERFARAELAENLGETELPSEARRDVIERATASVVAAARRARDAIARAAARASGTPRNSDAVSLARVRWSAGRRAGGGFAGRLRRFLLLRRGTRTRDTALAPARVRLRLGQAKVELRAEHFQKLGAPVAQPPASLGAAAAETEKDAAEIEGGGRFAKPTFAATRVSCARRSRAQRAWWPRKGACTAWPVGTTPRFTVRCSTCSNTARFVSRLSCSRRR